MKTAVQLLNDETGDDALGGGFAAAEKFHKNFYHNEMEDFEIEIDRPQVHCLVSPCAEVVAVRASRQEGIWLQTATPTPSTWSIRSG